MLHCELAKRLKIEAVSRNRHVLNAAYQAARLLLKGYGMRA